MQRMPLEINFFVKKCILTHAFNIIELLIQNEAVFFSINGNMFAKYYLFKVYRFNSAR
ncbi:hypothetical protein GCM10023260_04900 [Bartonella acomydis]|uniref:Uncharacterized protein n=1 Tax=Bartonella acomydis TaxID=686234 RepID=A0ABP9MG10_9HYPH